MKLSALYQDMKRTFEQEGLETPALDARVLLKRALGIGDADLIVAGETPVDAAAQALIAEWQVRRMAGEPVSRITGAREFWGREFSVTPDTLDPRPDTEILVEAALAWARNKNSLTILDLGTGTGCILITLLAELPGATGIGVDLNPGAVAVSRENAEIHGVASRARFIEGHWFDPLESSAAFDLIVSNPPYIRRDAIESLQKEVRNHDPILALEGGEDGYAAYKTIFGKIKNHLKNDGRAFFEVGFGQAEKVMRLADDSALFPSRTIPDLSGIPRVVEISHGEN